MLFIEFNYYTGMIIHSHSFICTFFLLFHLQKEKRKKRSFLIEFSYRFVHLLLKNWLFYSFVRILLGFLFQFEEKLCDVSMENKSKWKLLKSYKLNRNETKRAKKRKKKNKKWNNSRWKMARENNRNGKKNKK